jgi:hypothetical protein
VKARARERALGDASISDGSSTDIANDRTASADANRPADGGATTDIDSGTAMDTSLDRAPDAGLDASADAVTGDGSIDPGKPVLPCGEIGWIAEPTGMRFAATCDNTSLQLLPMVKIKNVWYGAGKNGACVVSGNQVVCPAAEFGRVGVEQSAGNLRVYWDTETAGRAARRHFRLRRRLAGGQRHCLQARGGHQFPVADVELHRQSSAAIHGTLALLSGDAVRRRSVSSPAIAARRSRSRLVGRALDRWSAVPLRRSDQARHRST